MGGVGLVRRSNARVIRRDRAAECRLESKQDGEGSGEDSDLLEKLFGVFFGKKEENPLGLKRFDRDRFPEQFPAPLDEFAEAVQGDSKDVALFRPLLARTQLCRRSLRLVFDTDSDGWTAEAFHRAVDRQGAGVVLLRTVDGVVCGGYNPKGWVGYGESRGSVASFLFTWPDGNTNKPAMKMRKVGQAYLSVLDNPETGPQFGADSLVIPLQDTRLRGPDGSEKQARSKLGSYYERLPDGRNCLFPDSSHPRKGYCYVDSVKVFVGVYEEGEQIPFNDALPFSLE